MSGADLGGDVQQIAEDVFPQLMGRAVIINLPSFFSSLFLLFKSLLPKRMQVRRALSVPLCVSSALWRRVEGTRFSRRLLTPTLY